MMQHYRRSLTFGFSLMELLVAMLIGLFILGGMLTVYLSSKKTYADREAISLMDESARTALLALTRHLEHAGYSATSGIILENYVLPTNATDAIKSGQCSGGSAGNVVNTSVIQKSKDGSGNSSDTVGILFSGSNTLFNDCTGGQLPADCRLEQSANTDTTLIYNGFSVATSTSEKNSAGTYLPMLYCHGSRSNAKQPIAVGVENMQIRYGVDTNQDKAADSYWNATTVEAKQAWGKIVNIQVALLIRSTDGFYDTAIPEVFQVMDKTITTNDHYRRAVYTTTIRLRNVGGN